VGVVQLAVADHLGVAEQKLGIPVVSLLLLLSLLMLRH
jgi:hypothetical protein